jgi:hypothetical protein
MPKINNMATRLMEVIAKVKHATHRQLFICQLHCPILKNIGIDYANEHCLLQNTNACPVSGLFKCIAAISLFYILFRQS